MFRSVAILAVFAVTLSVSALPVSAQSVYGSPLTSSFGIASRGNYVADDWGTNLQLHSQYPYDNQNYFGSAYDPRYNSYNGAYGYTGTTGGVNGVPVLRDLNDPRVFDEGFINNPVGFFGLPNTPNSMRYANYNNMDVVNQYYANSGNSYGYTGGNTGGYNGGYNNSYSSNSYDYSNSTYGNEGAFYGYLDYYTPVY